MIPSPIEREATNALRDLGGGAPSATRIAATIARARSSSRGRGVVTADVWDAARHELRAAARPAQRPSPRREATRTEALAWGRQQLAKREAKRERAALLSWAEGKIAERHAEPAAPRTEAAFAARQADRQRLVARLTGTQVTPSLVSIQRTPGGALEIRELPSVHVAMTPPLGTVTRPTLSPAAVARQADRDAMVDRLLGRTRLGPRVDRRADGSLASVSPEALVSAKGGAR